MRPIKTLNVPQIDSYIMTATLDLPLDLTIAALRKAGTGDSLLAALDALVTVTDEVADVTDSVEVLEVEDSVEVLEVEDSVEVLEVEDSETVELF